VNKSVKPLLFSWLVAVIPFFLVAVIPFIGSYGYGNESRQLRPPVHKELTNYYKQMQDSSDFAKNKLLHPKTDFLQPWVLSNWKYKDYKLYLEKIKASGMEYVVLQYVAKAMVVNGKAELTENYFHLKDIETNPHLPLVYSRCTKKNMIVSRYDAVDTLLLAAKDVGIKVYLGTTLSDQWWSRHFRNDQWRTEMVALEKLLISYFITKYKTNSHMSDTFHGIYYTPEMFGNMYGYETYWREMLGSIREHVYSQDQSLKFIVSLYNSEHYLFDDSDEQTIEEKMQKFVSDLLIKNDKAVLRDGDIVTVQDKLATNTKTSVAYNAKFLYAVRDVLKMLKSDYDNSLHYSIIVENFNSESNLTRAPGQRYTLQLLICSQLADDLMVFSYATYHMPKDKFNRPVVKKKGKSTP